MQCSACLSFSSVEVVSVSEANSPGLPDLKNASEILTNNPAFCSWRPPICSAGSQQLELVLFFSCSSIMSLLGVENQGIDNHPEAQNRCRMQNTLTPWPTGFTPHIVLVIGEPQKNNGGGQKHPAVFGKPHGHGKTSQAETGQD